MIGDNAFMADWVGWPEIHHRWPCYVKYLAGVFALQPVRAVVAAAAALQVLPLPLPLLLVVVWCTRSQTGITVLLTYIPELA